jgi:hypothetical protein
MRRRPSAAKRWQSGWRCGWRLRRSDGKAIAKQLEMRVEAVCRDRIASDPLGLIEQKEIFGGRGRPVCLPGKESHHRKRSPCPLTREVMPPAILVRIGYNPIPTKNPNVLQPFLHCFSIVSQLFSNKKSGPDFRRSP